MTERKKAQDVFNESTFLFGEKTTFDKAFPEIKNVRAEVTELGKGVSSRRSSMIYTQLDIGEYINCSNPLCYNGGFRLASIIRDMVRERKTNHEGDDFCRGYEGSPNGRKKYKDCDNDFKFKIQIEYNP